MSIPRERVFVAQPVPAAGGRVIVSPFQFLTRADDNLRVEGWNSVTGAVLQLTYRFAGLDGQVRDERQTVVLTADRVVTRQDFKLNEGYLVNLIAVVTNATPRVGQTFASIKLIRGITGATIVVGALLQGYVTHTQALAWPGSPVQNSLEVVPPQRVFTGTDPAAGAEILETVPTGARWELMSIATRLVTSGSAGNRRVRLALDDGTNTMIISAVPGVFAATTDRRAMFAQGLALETQIEVDALVAGLPAGLQLLSGFRISTSTLNMLSDDNYFAPVLSVREWLEAN